MANEAVKIYGTGNSTFTRNYTVANTPAITKGTLMFLSGDLTASFSNAGSGAIFAGIALADKEASDGQTQLALDIGGLWDLTASGTIPIGHKVIMAGGNKIQSIDATTAAIAASGGLVVGTALEAASDAEVIMVDLSRR